MSAEVEITGPAALWRPDGTVDRAAVGWSRGPVHTCRLPRAWGRRKRWHYWAVTSPREVISLTLADLDYVGLAVIVVHDRTTGRAWRDAAVRPLGWRTPWPEQAGAGTVTVEQRGVRLAFADDGAGIALVARGRGIAIDALVTRPAGHETLGVAVSRAPGLAQYTSKQTALPARGWLELDGVRRALAADAFACLDWGRGVWPAHTRWNWASAAGTRGGRTIGLNLGARWTDGGGATENALCVDGRITKLSGEVRFAWHRAGPRHPWRLTGPAVDLTLTPEIIEGRAGPRGGPLPLVLAFGTFHGRVAGLEVGPLFGWAEEVDAWW